MGARDAVKETERKRRFRSHRWRRGRRGFCRIRRSSRSRRWAGVGRQAARSLGGLSLAWPTIRRDLAKPGGAVRLLRHHARLLTSRRRGGGCSRAGSWKRPRTRRRTAGSHTTAIRRGRIWRRRSRSSTSTCVRTAFAGRSAHDGKLGGSEAAAADYRLAETVIGLRKTQRDDHLPPKHWLRQVNGSLLPPWVLTQPTRVLAADARVGGGGAHGEVRPAAAGGQAGAPRDTAAGSGDAARERGCAARRDHAAGLQGGGAGDLDAAGAGRAGGCRPVLTALPRRTQLRMTLRAESPDVAELPRMLAWPRYRRMTPGLRACSVEISALMFQSEGSAVTAFRNRARSSPLSSALLATSLMFVVVMVFSCATEEARRRADRPWRCRRRRPRRPGASRARRCGC